MLKLNKRIKELREFYNLNQAECAAKLAIHSQQLNRYEKGAAKPSLDFFNKLCEAFPNVNLNWLINGNGEMLNTVSGGQVAGDTVFIPYWDGCPEKVQKPEIENGIHISLNVVTKEWKCEPENLRLIATPGEDMDGGQYPIRNLDILAIDISKTNYSNSGVFLVTTHQGSIIALRRLVESMNNGIAFYVDNKFYADQINRIYTFKELEEMDFKIIGRVVKNVSYTL